MPPNALCHPVLSDSECSQVSAAYQEARGSPLPNRWSVGISDRRVIAGAPGTPFDDLLPDATIDTDDFGAAYVFDLFDDMSLCGGTNDCGPFGSVR